MIRTVHTFVNDKKPLAGYFLDTGYKCTNLYNRSMFLTRQAMTGSKKKHADRYPNEHKAFRDFKTARAAVNKVRIKTYKKKLKEAATSGNTKEYEKLFKAGPKLFKLPDAEHWYLNNNDLKMILQTLDDPDYRALQSNHAQRVIQQEGDAWVSYFEGLTAWKEDPSKFMGKPDPPYYKEPGSWSTIVYTNQNCRFVRDKKYGRTYLTFPHTKERLDLTGLLPVFPVDKYRLCEVRVVEKPHGYDVQISYDDGQAVPDTPAKPLRISGIDFGVENLVTLVNNVGTRPVLIKGGEIKAYNQWRNKTAAYYSSRAKTDNRTYNTTGIWEIWDSSDRYMGNILHLAANAVMVRLKEDRIDVLVVGKNDGWKQNCNMGKRNNQNFVQIPHAKLAAILKEKCEASGILYVEREESYTSKASFLDTDPIPVYTDEMKGKYAFSGKRTKRGLYISSDGRMLNADVNGAANTIRKEYPDAFKDVADFKYLMNPEVWEIQMHDGRPRVCPKTEVILPAHNNGARKPRKKKPA